MPSWRCSTGILKRLSSACVSGDGQTQSHSGTIAARSTKRVRTTLPTSVMVIALPSAATGLFDSLAPKQNIHHGDTELSSEIPNPAKRVRDLYPHRVATGTHLMYFRQ